MTRVVIDNQLRIVWQSRYDGYIRDVSKGDGKFFDIDHIKITRTPDNYMPVTVELFDKDEKRIDKFCNDYFDSGLGPNT